MLVIEINPFNEYVGAGTSGAMFDVRPPLVPCRASLESCLLVLLVVARCSTRTHAPSCTPATVQDRPRDSHRPRSVRVPRRDCAHRRYDTAEARVPELARDRVRLVTQRPLISGLALQSVAPPIAEQVSLARGLPGLGQITGSLRGISCPLEPSCLRANLPRHYTPDTSTVPLAI